MTYTILTVDQKVRVPGLLQAAVCRYVVIQFIFPPSIRPRRMLRPTVSREYTASILQLDREGTCKPDWDRPVVWAALPAVRDPRHAQRRQDMIMWCILFAQWTL